MKTRQVVLLVVWLLAGAAEAAEGPAIRWEPFALPEGVRSLEAQLGRMTVPLVRSRPDGASAEIAFVRVRSSAKPTGAPIVFLPGGPGGSGISVARQAQSIASFGKLAELGDLILLDPRGAGMSTPRPTCQAAKALEPRERFLSGAVAMRRIADGAKACADLWNGKGVDVRGFTNAESAADLDDLRRALGVDRIRLFGFSYGTHLALAALRDHGAGIERAVLVGTEGPNHTRKLPLTLDTQLAKLSLLASRDASIAAEVPDMAELLRRVLRKLDKMPMKVTVHDLRAKTDVQIAVGADTLRRILVADIGDGNDFPVFPALLHTIDQGDPSILSWFVEKRYNGITGGVDLMVLGMECSSGATANRQAEIGLQAHSSLFANTMNAPFPEVCAALPPVDLGDRFRGPLISDVPVLFVSGTLDSNAPPFQAEELRFGMPRAEHLIVTNAGHEDTLPDPNVQSIIYDFLAGKDVSNRRAALPAPDFLSVEEAKKNRQR